MACLGPPQGTMRGTAIEGVLFTSADIDHTLGTVLLRESETPLLLHAPAAVRDRLEWLDQLLQPFCGIIWRQPPTVAAMPLLLRNGEASGLSYQSINTSAASQEKNAVAYIIEDDRSGRRILIAADLATAPEDLCRLTTAEDLILWDGTFWSEDELGKVAGDKPDASGMGHLPLSRTAELLQRCAAKTKVLVHINNTNPILLHDTAERAILDAAGITVGEDGMAFEL